MLQAYLLLIGPAIFWSFSFIAIEHAIASCSIIFSASSRVILAGIVLYFFLYKRRAECNQYLREHWKYLSLVGALTSIIPFTFICWGQLHIDSSVASLLMGCVPVMVLVMSILAAYEKLTVINLSAVCIGFVGLLVHLLSDPNASFVKMGLWGQMAIIAATFCYALSSIMIKGLSFMPAMVLSRNIFLIAGVQGIVLILAEGGYYVYVDGVESVMHSISAAMTTEVIGSVLYLGLFATAISSIMLYRLLALATPTFVSFQSYIIPLLGYFAGIWLLDEPFRIESIIGLLIIVSSLVLITYAKAHKSEA